MIDITAADFGLPEWECDEKEFIFDPLIFDSHIFKDMKSIKEQIMKSFMIPERILMSEETWNEMVKYGKEIGRQEF